MDMIQSLVAQFMAFIKSILELFGVDTSRMPSIETEEDAPAEEESK